MKGIELAVAIVAIVMGIIGVAGFVGTLIAYTRFQGLRQTVDLLATSNNELRSELQDERTARAKLEGQLDILIGDFASRVVEAVAKGLHVWMTNNQLPESDGL